MNDLDREKKKGLSLLYLVRVLFMRKELGPEIPDPGLRPGGPALRHGREACHRPPGPGGGRKADPGRGRGVREGAGPADRGNRAGPREAALAQELAHLHRHKRRRILPPGPTFPDGDLEACVGACTFIGAARKWGLVDYARLYCKYADYAILGGYNPDVTLVLRDRHSTGTDECVFRYIMKEENKK